MESSACSKLSSRCLADTPSRKDVEYWRERSIVCSPARMLTFASYSVGSSPAMYSAVRLGEPGEPAIGFPVDGR